MPISLQFPLPLSDVARARAAFLFYRACVQGDQEKANKILVLAQQDAELDAMLRGSTPGRSEAPLTGE